jgi:hypothetical protein
MTRQKRTAQVKAYIPESFKEQLELFAQQAGNVISMSDYLHTVIEEHIAMRIAKQTIGRRVGNQ